MPTASDAAAIDPRVRHFEDKARPDMPFADPTWRGCCLDRDRFDATRMPRFLFEALMTATGTQAIDVHFYMTESAVRGVAPDWPAFRAVAGGPANESLEHVICDASGTWAVLCELDVMLLGATPELATRIDAELAAHGTSLALMTAWDWPEIRSDDPRFAFMRAAVGPEPRYWPAP